MKTVTIIGLTLFPIIGLTLFPITGVAFVALSSYAQGTFQNLNFEQANPIYSDYPLYVTAASALPYWTVYYGNVQQTQITYDATSTGSTLVSLIGPGGSSGFPPFAPIDGNYSVVLTGGGTSPGASISQTGLIPAGSQSLLFDAQLSPFVSPGILEVSIGGENDSFFALEIEPNYTIYWANTSAWAGDTEQLTLSALEGEGLNDWEIDDISFSPTFFTPEPNAMVLIVMGGVAFAARHWRTRKSCNHIPYCSVLSIGYTYSAKK